MNFDFKIVLLVLFAVHVGMAFYVHIKISTKISELSKSDKFKKKAVVRVEELKKYRLLVTFLPIAGPVVGYAISVGIKPGVYDNGGISDGSNNSEVGDGD